MRSVSTPCRSNEATSGTLLAEDLAQPDQDGALGIVLAVGGHRAVERGVDRVDRARAARRLEQLAGDARQVGRAEHAARGHRLGAVAGDDLDVRAGAEHPQRAGKLALDAAVQGQQRLPGGHHEVLVAARNRVERGDLVPALDDQDATHRGVRQMTAAGRTIDPVAPRMASGVSTSRNSETPSPRSSSVTMFSRM